MNKPLVTVFIAVYNGEKYIKDSLESIIKQTYENLEILIIDDGSTDNTCSIINKYNDSRIKLIKNKSNKGLPYTRNKALELFKGKYLAILDADDISVPHRIERQVDFLENHKNIDVVTSNYTVFNNKISKNIKINRNIDRIKISLIFGCSLCNSTAMIRKDSLEKYNIRYNPSCFVAQDYEMWCQFSKKGNIYNIQDTLLRYRIGHENITKRTKNTKVIERQRVINNIQDDMLNYYGFVLGKEEKIFHDLFSDTFDSNILIKYNPYQIRELLERLIKINNEKCIFNEKDFLEELNWATKQRIFNQKIKLSQKLKLYKVLINENKIPYISLDVIKMLLKHIQMIIKKNF